MDYRRSSDEILDLLNELLDSYISMNRVNQFGIRKDKWNFIREKWENGEDFTFLSKEEFDLLSDALVEDEDSFIYKKLLISKYLRSKLSHVINQSILIFI